LVYKASAMTPSIIEQTSNGYSHQLQQLQSNKNLLSKPNSTKQNGSQVLRKKNTADSAKQTTNRRILSSVHNWF
jgi:hypothetical protein